MIRKRSRCGGPAAAPADGRGTPRALARAAALLAAALLPAGCARQPTPPAPSGLRLVSTAPNLTECVCAIGAGDCLAGRTDACDYPPEVTRVPVIGGFGTPCLEPLLATRPTHVLETVLADPDVVRRLRALGIPVVHVSCSRLHEVPEALVQLGVLTGRERAAGQLAARLRAGLNAARAEAEGLAAKPRVALLFAPDSPITAGRHAFVAELLALAGGENIGDASDTDYYPVSLEWLLTQKPDLILCLFDVGSRDPAALFAAQTGWRSLDAVRQRRVYTVPDLSTVSRPGPRLLEGLAQLKALLARDAQRADPPREN